MSTPPDPQAAWWTTSDVAAYLGLHVGTVSSYRIRGQMPEPDKTVGRTHMWRPARIVGWHESRPRRGIGGRAGSELADAAGDTVSGRTEFIEVSTATDTRDNAERLAKAIVEARLAAGAQIIGPVGSAFWHLGEFGIGEEWRLVLKTRLDRYSELEALIVELHPWEKPEVSAVPLVAGSDAYLDWIRRMTTEQEEQLTP